jgi:hypothetical protein
MPRLRKPHPWIDRLICLLGAIALLCLQVSVRADILTPQPPREKRRPWIVVK